MLKVRLANPEDYTAVRDFYYDVIDAMEDSKFSPGWEKDIYPTQEFLRHSIESAELYMGELEEGLAACMVVNHEYNEGYKEISWSVDVKDEELSVIHILGVRPDYAGKGIAKKMALKALDIARENQIKTVRLDVLEGNLPAEKAYTRIGFQYLGTIQMFYEDTGWTNFKVYEYVI